MVDVSGVLRYLGVREADAGLRERARAALAQAQACARFRVKSARLPIAWDAGCLLSGSQRFSGAFLQKQLAGCREALFFAATLGAELDRELARQSALSMSGAVLLNAAANALLDQELAAWRREQNRLLAPECLALTLRACPGYGDWAVEDLPRLLPLAGARHIGVTATEGYMLAPGKSIAGVMGLCREARPCEEDEDCSRCQKDDCQYRREKQHGDS